MEQNDEFTEQELEAGRKLFAGPCEFMLGVADLTQLPEARYPEIAFAGRSNVGKSSLVNALGGRKILARVSNTPGRTQELNYFNLGHTLYMVDMPGYGYAKVSRSMQKKWLDMVNDFLIGRETLRCVLILVDARHGLKPSDREMMTMLDKAAVSYRIVLTKCDKGKNLDAMEKSILEDLKKHAAAFNKIYRTSAHKNTGLAELRATIRKIAIT